GPVPMDLDAMGVNKNKNNGKPKFKKLTPAERKQLQAVGACFRCRVVGHTAKDCKQGQPTPVAPVTTAASTSTAALYKAYPALLNMPTHTVSRKAIGFHNIETNTDEDDSGN